MTGESVVVGSPSFAAEGAPLPGDAEQAVAEWESQGKTVVVVSVNGTYTGLIAVRDEPRPDAPAVAAASVDVAMGGGTDVALETTDAAIQNSRVGGHGCPGRAIERDAC